MMGLLFRTLAQMRNRDRLRAVAGVIGAMGHKKASCWLGMTMHRKHPRRVLVALRILFDGVDRGANYAGCLMKLCRLGTGNYRAIEELRLGLHPPLRLATFSQPRSG